VAIGQYKKHLPLLLNPFIPQEDEDDTHPVKGAVKTTTDGSSSSSKGGNSVCVEKAAFFGF
jgi:hypothetical protein